MNGVLYTKDQIAYLKVSYPYTSMPALLKKLHPHTEDSIRRKAHYLGLKRRRTSKPRFKILEQLRAAREAAGMTRAELAAGIGYHLVMLGRWERGDQFPSIQRLHDWADALGSKIVLEPVRTYEAKERTDKIDTSIVGAVSSEILGQL